MLVSHIANKMKQMTMNGEKEKCKQWDLNPRVRTHYDLNVAP